MSTVSIINRVPPNALSLGHWKNLLSRAGSICLAQPKFYNSPKYLSLTYTFKLPSVLWLTALPFKVERGEEGHCSVCVGREQAGGEAEGWFHFLLV